MTQRLEAGLVQKLRHGTVNFCNLKEGSEGVGEDLCVAFDGTGEKVELGKGFGEGGFEGMGKMERVIGLFESVEEDERSVSKGGELIKN